MGKARKKKKKQTNSAWTYKDSKGNNMLINIEVSVDEEEEISSITC